MFDYFTIRELVTLESMYLDKHILQHIHKKLSDVKTGQCTKVHGFIKAVENVRIVSSYEISMADSSNRFLVEYSLKTILPKIGNVYASKEIVSVIEHNDFHGAIVTIDDTCDGNPFQIFITNGVCKSKKYKFTDCKCLFPVTGKQLQFVLPCIKVDCVLFKDNQFRVTGKHLHEKEKEKHDK